MSMVTELCTGSHLHSSTPYPEARARKIIAQILDAVRYMHKRGLCHNNLTTENSTYITINLSSSLSFLSCAHRSSLFCFSVMFQDDSPDAKIKITYAGVSSPHPSESEFGTSHEWGKQGKDVYSVGMIAYKLLSGGKEPPTDTDKQLVLPGSNLFLGRCWNHIIISLNAKKFIENCLQPESSRPFTVAQAIHHPWITRESAYSKVGSRPTLQEATYPAEISMTTTNSAGDSSVGPIRLLINHEPHGIKSVVPMTVSLSTEKYKLEIMSQKEIHGSDWMAPASLLNETPEGTCQPVNGMSQCNKNAIPTTAKEHCKTTSLALTDLVDTSFLSETEGLYWAAGNPLVMDESDGKSLPHDELCENVTEQFPIDKEFLSKCAGPEELCEDVTKPTLCSEEFLPQEAELGELSVAVAESHFMDAPNKTYVGVSCKTFDCTTDLILTSSPEHSEFPTPHHFSTPSEFLDLHDVFHQIEKDDNGDVTVENLKASLRTKCTEDEVNSWFQGGMFDDSKSLEYTEFLSEAIRSRRTIELRRVKEAFDKLDKGRQGFVTVGNLRAVLGVNNSENIEMLIKAADKKREGKITHANFEKVVRHWLEGKDF